MWRIQSSPVLQFISVPMDGLNWGPSRCCGHWRTPDPVYEGQERLLRITADSLTMHAWLLHCYGIVILSNYNGQTVTRLLCRRREEATSWVVTEGPEEVNGDAEGSQSGQVDTFGFRAANLCSLPCQPGIRSWPSGWNSEKDYVWARKVWKRLGLGVFLFFSFFGYDFKS